MHRASLLGIAALAAALAAGCSKGSEDPGDEAEPPTSGAPATAADPAATEPAKPALPTRGPIGAAVGEGGTGEARAAGIEALPFEATAVDRDMPHKGKVVGGQRWRDGNGDNMLVLSRIERMADDGMSSVFLYANHFVRGADGKVRLLREVKDRYEDCEFDNMTRFLSDANQVTDLDNDGLGEVWFAYVVDCTSDVAPLTTKLLGLENGDKYIIRGRIDDTGLTQSEKKVDASLTRGPEEFAEHADSLWIRLSRVE
jgi:hypothetical protein